MSRRVLVEAYQEITGEDVTNIGAFAQDAIDTVVFDGVVEGSRYAGCLVIQDGVAGISVAPGRAYIGGKVYPRAEATAFSLTASLPLALTRIATVVIAGQETNVDLQPRDYIINESTGETEARTAPRERRRSMTVEVIYGAEAANPVRAVVAPGAVAVADILLSPSGVQTITMLTANKLRSAQANFESIQALEGFRDTAGRRIDTLATDIANLKERTAGIISPVIYKRVVRDVARLNKIVNVKDTAISYSWDYFLNTANADPTHPQWLAKVEEGVRFPAAQERLAILRPLNPAEPKLRKTGSFALPNYSTIERISVVGNDGELSISQYQHQTTNMVRREVSHSAVRHGASYTTCTNRSEFYTGDYNEISQTLTRDGQTFAVEFTGHDYDPGNQHEGDHVEVRLTETWTDSWTEVYWDAVTVTEGLNGSVISQTFLNANAGWMTHLNLFFTRVGTTGDVHVLLTDVTASGSPNPARTIAKATISAANLKTWPEKTKVDFVPTHLEPGKRYAIMMITPGNHFIALVNNNKFSEGTLFHSTDGAWFQGNINQDMAFEVGFARFDGARVEVDFDPLTLENGIANIKLLMVGAQPQGTRLTFEYERNSIWYPITLERGDGAASPLYGLPALCRLRAVFVGSSDDMPGIDVALSEVTTWRPRVDFRWVSKNFDLGSGVTTSTIELDVRVEAFDPVGAAHTLTAKVLRGPGQVLETPDVTSVEIDPYDPSARIYKYVFNLASATQTYRIQLEGASNSAVKPYHIANMFQQAL